MDLVDVLRESANDLENERANLKTLIEAFEYTVNSYDAMRDRFGHLLDKAELACTKDIIKKARSSIQNFKGVE